MKTILSIITLGLLFSSSVMAKRIGPPKVAPIVTKSAIYSAPAFHHAYDHHGGVIEAREPGTEKLLWRVRVYEVVYEKNLETDVQDVFIRTLSLDKEHGLLIMSDESNRVFVLDMDTKKVTQIK